MLVVTTLPFLGRLSWLVWAELAGVGWAGLVWPDLGYACSGSRSVAE